MLETRGQPDLLTESVGRQGVREVRREHFDDDWAAKGDFGREEDTRHPTTTELPFDGVRAERACQLVPQVHRLEPIEDGCSRLGEM